MFCSEEDNQLSHMELEVEVMNLYDVIVTESLLLLQI